MYGLMRVTREPATARAQRRAQPESRDHRSIMESTLINPQPPGGRTLTGPYDVTDKSDIDVLHEIGSRIAAADPLHTELNRVVQFD